jgi:hypothetical protein
LTGRLAALSRFISKLDKKALPFYRLLRKTDNFTWTEEAQAAFDDLKRRLSTAFVMRFIPGNAHVEGLSI